MKNQLTYLIIPLIYLFFAVRSNAQTCSGLSFTYTTSESRCMSTGSITITIITGNGNHNYKAVGPVITQFTSSTIITGLQPGTYQLIVKDINGNCADTANNVIITGSYADPRFLLNKTDVSCARNDGTIDVT